MRKKYSRVVKIDYDIQKMCALIILKYVQRNCKEIFLSSGGTL